MPSSLCQFFMSIQVAWVFVVLCYLYLFSKAWHRSQVLFPRLYAGEYCSMDHSMSGSGHNEVDCGANILYILFLCFDGGVVDGVFLDAFSLQWDFSFLLL